jgi:hypothetical protein
LKIPIFEELIFENYEIEYLKKRLNVSRVSQVPIYINLTHLKKDQRLQAILNLKSAFLGENLNPRFPYPCYVITEKVPNDYFPQVLSIKELPDHFFKKVKRPNNKELQLLNKLGLKVEKIKNLDMNNLTEQLKETSLSQKKLYQSTKELYFLELLNYKLFEIEKDNIKGKYGKKI